VWGGGGRGDGEGINACSVLVGKLAGK